MNQEKDEILEKSIFEFLSHNTRPWGNRYTACEICDRLEAATLVTFSERGKIHGILENLVKKRKKGEPGIEFMPDFEDKDGQIVYYYDDPEWLTRQMDECARDFASWPAWMRNAARQKGEEQEYDHYIFFYESLRDKGARYIKASGCNDAYKQASEFMKSKKAKDKGVLKALGLVRIMECYDNTLAEVLQNLGAEAKR